MGKILSIAVPFLLIILGVVKLIDQADIYRKLKTEDAWGETKGIISKSEVVNVYEEGSWFEKANFIKRSNPYGLKISYEYTQSGELLTGHRVLNTELNFATEQAARIYAKNYHLAKPVDVYFLKNNPTFALLDLSLNKYFWQVTAFFVVLLMVGLAALKGAFK